MTIIRGVRIVAAPCCGARYAVPRYVSMNFMAFEYWTDGWCDGSLMPNDQVLRVLFWLILIAVVVYVLAR